MIIISNLLITVLVDSYLLVQQEQRMSVKKSHTVKSEAFLQRLLHAFSNCTRPCSRGRAVEPDTAVQAVAKSTCVNTESKTISVAAADNEADESQSDDSHQAAPMEQHVQLLTEHVKHISQELRDVVNNQDEMMKLMRSALASRGRLDDAS